MKICDPIHGYIYFNQEERALIESSFFQRLRWIQQLGFVHYAFPAGVSNRYVHSLGVCDLAGQVFDSVFSKKTIKDLNLNSKKKAEFKKILKFAALLHDIGHGPLSHTSECFMPQLKDLKVPFIDSARGKARHEDYTVKIISESSIAQTLQEFGVELPCLILLLHSEVKDTEGFFKENGVDYLPILKQIINSDLDVDRMDYLQRDSYFCGVRYGIFDFQWMISHFDAHLKEGSVYLALHKEALHTAENFLLGRHYMHFTVYYHHKPVIYEQMLKRALKDWTLPLDVEEYKKIVDKDIFNLLARQKPDNEWANRILNNKPYERLYESDEGESESQKLIETLEKKKIHYIETNSIRDSLNSIQHKTSFKKPIFIKNSFSKKVSYLGEKEKSLLEHHSKTNYRIYVSPEDISEARKIVF